MKWIYVKPSWWNLWNRGGCLIYDVDYDFMGQYIDESETVMETYRRAQQDGLDVRLDTKISAGANTEEGGFMGIKRYTLWFKNPDDVVTFKLRYL